MKKMAPHNTFMDLLILMSIAIVVGIYLIITTTLIAKDGVSYIQYAQALSSSPLEVIQDCSGLAPDSYTPGYPFLILMTHSLIDVFGDFSTVFSWIYSAQAIALFCRILALIPLYYIGKEFVGRKLSFWALLILVILPEPAKLGSDALRDWPHMLFLATGFLFLLWGVRYKKWALFGLVGVIAGLGYLIRPVCAQLLIYAILWLILNLFKRPHQQSLSKTRLVGGLALLLIGFSTIATPYIAIRGEFLPTRIQQTMERFSCEYEHNGILDQNDDICQAGIMSNDTVQALWEIFEEINTNLMYFFVPFLFIGLYSFYRKSPKSESYFFITAFISFNIVILILRYRISPVMSSRYVFPLVTFTVFLVPVGLQVSVRIIHKLLWKNSNSEEQSQRWFFILLIIGIAICFPKLLRPLRIEKKEYRLAAEWLNKNTRKNSLLAVSGIDSRIAFYAGRESIRAMSQDANYVVKMCRNDTRSIYEGGVFALNGKGDFIDSGTNPLPSSGDFTLSGWVYCEGEMPGNRNRYGTAFGSASWSGTAVRGIVIRCSSDRSLGVTFGDGISNGHFNIVNNIKTENRQKWYQLWG
jgi:hypothetical protein